MIKQTAVVAGRSMVVYSLDTVIVGSGAAGFCAANRLHAEGRTDIALVTEDLYGGTSRNSGSDKQTYYKLTLSGSEPDSVRAMADTLVSGGCTDGDTAVCEAALSARCFMRLAEMGVRFPVNRYGEFAGYKTDHDPRSRAASAGPYTSREMTGCLQAAAESAGIRIFDKTQVIKVLSCAGKISGLLCVQHSGRAGSEPAYTLFHCLRVIYATGGPAGIYKDSVYPAGHNGASGLAFEAGVTGVNLTEWQYGLASLHPRWNVSGTYMQSLPCFISTDSRGEDERVFLEDAIADLGRLASLVFLKGYQWPFDVQKASGGSSLIDILVYTEREKGRRVYLDFRRNPFGAELDFASLAPEAYEYLKKAGACFGTPIDRLEHMNRPAVDFYRDKGVDLRRERLEIALCAQHNNGGLGVDCWWQTNLEGFFAVGEAAGTHGVYRPGGSALNAGQAGATRAARYIASLKPAEAAPDIFAFISDASNQTEALLAMMDGLVKGEDTVRAVWDNAAARMSRVAGPIRSAQGITEALSAVREEIGAFGHIVGVRDADGLPEAFRLRDMLICQEVYLSAMADYIKHGGKSRGGALYVDKNDGIPRQGCPEEWAITPDAGALKDTVQETTIKKGRPVSVFRSVRPIPEEDDFFENVWRQFRETGGIY